MTFEQWFRASKYCQVVIPAQGWEQIAQDGWDAAIAECVRRLREQGKLEDSWRAWRITADWLEEEMQK